MKRLILLLFCVFITQPAFTNINSDTTVERCVAEVFNLTSCTPTSQSIATSPLTPDWEMTCTITGTSKRQIVHGIAMCSSTAADINGAQEVLSLASTSSTYTTNNKYCYCRVTIPEPTPWVMLKIYANSATCLTGCRTYCAQTFAQNQATRTVMASHILPMLGNRGPLR
ncbi:MAG: hypothetical protein IJD52_03150 [Alphaproteobacteria bacterium]|nr:hypothetical protein [Alphaproteobacteria bacterium]